MSNDPTPSPTAGPDARTGAVSSTATAIRPIRRLLIANRGEIAVRIARTARSMGIGTVGVHSALDRGALHTTVMDVSVCLGGDSPAESYLRGDAVLAAALDQGCDAVHPGYGFLAENAAFARSVERAGLVWVGPTPEQIELLGDKIAAKRAALEAGVPTTPVFEVPDGTVLDGALLGAAVDQGLPMPALVKAAAGGGGRGMRVVRHLDELPDAITAASREAEAAFGDGTVFIEAYLERGRHVEVQILGDAHGSVLHLGERECSIQRRNQKVLEEAPAVGIDAATRAALCDGAVALARHVGYRNAGTVEYLVGEDGTVTFLEVNTRLQVEHPVTEAVTGLDLVELQLRVAAGEPLPLAQDDVTIEGHAIEVRVVAEDPAAAWLPATGRLDRFEVDPSLRCDSGVRTGSVVPAAYDSLLAKVIAHGRDRAEAAAHLRGGLSRSWIAGPLTNHASLVALLGERDYLSGDTTTAYLDEHPEVLSAAGADEATSRALLVAATLVTEGHNRAADDSWGFAPSGWRNLRIQGQRSRWVGDDGSEHQVELTRSARDVATVLLGAWPDPDETGALGEEQRAPIEVRTIELTDDTVTLELDGVARTVRHATLEGRVLTSCATGWATWSPVPRFEDHDAVAAGGGPHAPLPGTVLEVLVSVGDQVSDGDPLVVLEAMKMEHTIRATGAGTVSELRCEPGARVDAGDVLVVLDGD